MKITKIPQIKFQGYDAAPLKSIYMHRNDEDGIIDEMKHVADSEKIKLVNYTDGYYRQWAQDDKFLTEVQNSKPILLKEKIENHKGFAKKIKKNEGIDSKEPKIFLTGGNMFMGKKENGEKWLLVGADEIAGSGFSKTTALEEISKTYDVKPENITILNQPNFHLDMSIRPIGYPYVLVNDPKLTARNLKRYHNKIPEKVFEEKTYFYPSTQSRTYAPCEMTINELEEAGFIPIRIAGIYSFDKGEINYMNAIVNKHKDGTVSYITNSAKDTYFSVFDKIFENDLKMAVKNLDKIHFVSGKETPNLYNARNPMMYILKNMHGGIHCMSLEEPDFKKWGADENK